MWNSTDVGIRTAHLWCRKRPLYQLNLNLDLRESFYPYVYSSLISDAVKAIFSRTFRNFFFWVCLHKTILEELVPRKKIDSYGNWSKDLSAMSWPCWSIDHHHHLWVRGCIRFHRILVEILTRFNYSTSNPSSWLMTLPVRFLIKIS